MINDKLKNPGLVHIYTGDGKGKTTAALGIGFRACGRGMKVLMVQFLKGWETGEMYSIERLSPDFELFRGKELKKFTWQMNEKELKEASEIQKSIFMHAKNEVEKGELDLLILDEIMAAINTGLLDKEELLAFIRNKPVNLELVMTGRNAPEELIEVSDYVSEIACIKHPMKKGIASRLGIES